MADIKAKKKINSKTKSKKKNSKKSPKKVLLSIFFIILFFALIYLGYFLCTNSKFSIQKINVSGNTKYTSEQIIEASNLSLNRNIFLFNDKKHEQLIDTLAFVKTSKISRKFPDTLNIAIEERKAKYIAYDKDNNLYYLLDDQGVILESVNIENKTTDELLTYGITFDDNVKFGDKINDSDLSKLNVYNEIEQKVTENSINLPITRLNFENSLTTIVLNDKISVVLPNDTNLDYNITFLSNILKQIPEDSVGTLDMTKSNPVFSSM